MELPGDYSQLEKDKMSKSVFLPKMYLEDKNCSNVIGYFDLSCYFATKEAFEAFKAQVAKGLTITEVTAASYNVLATDYYISYQRTATGTGSINLRPITADNHGEDIEIKDADYNASVNSITVNPSGSDKVEGVASPLVISGDGNSWKLKANNTTKNWEAH